MSLISQITEQAAKAARVLAIQNSTIKTAVLLDMAEALRVEKSSILMSNKADLASANSNNLSESMIDRLTLNEQRIEDMAVGLETIANFPEVVGSIEQKTTRPNGLSISKMKIPLGVICMIYEARPNVTADAAALCLKSGNAVILRGGKEALSSSLAIADVLRSVLAKHSLPKEIISVVPDPDRALLSELLTRKDDIDLVIPRGGEGLINFVSETSQIPVIQHFKGVCHLYVDKDADLDKALKILMNGKTQRTGVCNALEGLLVHQEIADSFLPRAAQALKQHGVKVNGCKKAVHFFEQAKTIEENEFGEEYLSLEIAVRIVDDLSQALDHIAHFGSNHTEVICTESQTTADTFQRTVDASVVMVNASSRFSDGSELGLGAEIGIATTKLHAYGPMGIESLTTEKYLVNGTGQIRN